MEPLQFHQGGFNSFRYRRRELSQKWNIFFSLAWIITALPWMLIFVWPQLWFIAFIMMFLLMLLLYGYVPYILYYRRKKVDIPLASQSEEGRYEASYYQEGYQERGSRSRPDGFEREGKKSELSQSHSSEHPQAVYPEQEPPVAR